MPAWLFKIVNHLGLYPKARAVRIWLDHHTPGGKARHRRRVRFYSQFIGPGDLCFDIGAHVGDRAEYFLELGARVVCVEPIEDCVGVLRRRFGCNGSLQVIHKAVGEKESAVEFHVCDCNPQLSTLSTKWMEQGRHAADYRWDRTVRILLTTLDALIAAHGVPRFCKIDVEGAEEAVLKGLSRPMPCLSIEFHGELPEETQKCLDRIGAIGPASFNCTINDAPELLLPEWTTANALYERLRTMSASTWGDIYVRFCS
jgi:FkbM family methyltransferase